MGAELHHADRQKDMMKLTVVLRSSADAYWQPYRNLYAK